MLSLSRTNIRLLLGLVPVVVGRLQFPWCWNRIFMVTRINTCELIIKYVYTNAILVRSSRFEV